MGLAYLPYSTIIWRVKMHLLILIVAITCMSGRRKEIHSGEAQGS